MGRAKHGVRAGGAAGSGLPSVALRTKLVGANTAPHVSGRGRLPSRTNYFIGNDRQRWRSDVPNYAAVAYQDVYPGVDLIYHGADRQLEYDFIISPGADPGAPRLAFDGVAGLPGQVPIRIDKHGYLILSVAGGEIRQRKPVAYQEQHGIRTPIQVDYVLRSAREVGFRVGRYDTGVPLVVDPTLSYSTFLGGIDNDEAFGIAVDPNGNAYVVGRTASPGTPFTPLGFPVLNAAQPQNQGGFDVFVTKLTPDGQLAYSTFLGGIYDDEGFGIAVDPSGSVYITGRTSSPGSQLTPLGFPVLNAFQPDNDGGFDAFVVKLTSDGQLAYSTFLGGVEDDAGCAIAVDAFQNAYVSGQTASTAKPKVPQGFPVLNAFRPQPAGGYDAFITKMATRSVISGPCTGDCDASGSVTVDEILTMVNIALGNADISACIAGDANKDGKITVDEILTAVNNALNGCP